MIIESKRAKFVSIGLLIAICIVTLLFVSGTFTHPGEVTQDCSFALFEDPENNNTLTIGFLGSGYSAEIRKMQPCNEYGIGQIVTFVIVDRKNANPYTPESYPWPEEATGVLIAPSKNPAECLFIPVAAKSGRIYPFTVVI